MWTSNCQKPNACATIRLGGPRTGKKAGHIYMAGATKQLSQKNDCLILNCTHCVKMRTQANSVSEFSSQLKFTRITIMQHVVRPPTVMHPACRLQTISKLYSDFVLCHCIPDPLLSHRQLQHPWPTCWSMGPHFDYQGFMVLRFKVWRV